jgi:Spy/CpxP family protein refolding chaperone
MQPSIVKQGYLMCSDLLKEEIMNTKLRWLVFLSLGVLMVAQAAQAQAGRSGKRFDPALKLTEEQSLKIREMRLAFREELLPLRMNMEKARLNLEGLILKNADRKQIDAKRDEIYALEKELDGKKLDHRSQIRGILTEEQRVIFDRSGGLGMGRGMGAGHNRQGRMRMNTGRMGRGMGRGMGWR